MKKILVILIAIILTFSGCSSKQNDQSSRDLSSIAGENSSADISNSITSSAATVLMVENDALISSGLKKSLTVDTLFGVKIYGNCPPDVDLSAKMIETFQVDGALTYLYIVPRYVGSSITIESTVFDESNNEFVVTQLLFESICTDDYAVLAQADLPEAGPKLRITVAYENLEATYEPTYGGRGDTVYPQVKNGVLLDEAPFSASANTNTQADFQSVVAQFSKEELVVDSAFAEPLANTHLLKEWVSDYQQGKPGKVAVFMDGLGFPSLLSVLESDGSATYTITCYGDTPSDSSIIYTPSVYQSSLIIEREYDYVFGADYPADSRSDSLVVHHRPAPTVEKMDWNPDIDKLIGKLTLEQVQETAKLIDERIVRYGSVIPSFYSGGYYLRQSVLDAAGDHFVFEMYYKVTGAVKIDGNPFYLVYGNRDIQALEQGEHGGVVLAVSGGGSLVFNQSMVDGSWIFVDDKNQNIISYLISPN